MAWKEGSREAGLSLKGFDDVLDSGLAKRIYPGNPSAKLQWGGKTVFAPF